LAVRSWQIDLGTLGPLEQRIIYQGPVDHTLIWKHISVLKPTAGASYVNVSLIEAGDARPVVNLPVPELASAAYDLWIVVMPGQQIRLDSGTNEAMFYVASGALLQGRVDDIPLTKPSRDV
jgi:hypothetical protein